MQTTNYPQREPETTVSNRSVLGYIWNIAKHAIPIVGAIGLSYNLGNTGLLKANAETNSEKQESSIITNSPIREEKAALLLQEVLVEHSQEAQRVKDPYSLDGRFRQTFEYTSEIKQAEQKYGIPEGLLAGLIMQESCGNSSAVSYMGAAGLTQLMPLTADELGLKVWSRSRNISFGGAEHTKDLEYLVKKNKKSLERLTSLDERFDSSKSIEQGARYLKGLYDGDWGKALRKYHMGPNHERVNRDIKYPKSVRRYQEYWNQRTQSLAYDANIPKDKNF